MASIKRNEVLKINEGCSNGFKLDLNYFLMWNEKQLEKQIGDPAEKLTVYKIHYRKGGYSWRTGKKEENTIELSQETQTPCRGYDPKSSCNLYQVNYGKSVTLETGWTRRNTKHLQELSAMLTDEKIAELFQA